MRTLKISKDCIVPVENISIILNYSSKWVINSVKKAKAEQNVIDVTCGKKTISAIMLKDGKYVLSNTSVATLETRMNDDKTE